MNMISEYFKEFCGDLTVETPKGFAIYRFVDEKSVYIVHIYVIPECREENHASAIADEVVMMAKERGCTRLLGSVVPSANASSLSMRVLLGYGMSPFAIEGNMVLFKKDI